MLQVHSGVLKPAARSIWTQLKHGRTRHIYQIDWVLLVIYTSCHLILLVWVLLSHCHFAIF